jgi:hypothetical protein
MTRSVNASTVAPDVELELESELDAEWDAEVDGVVDAVGVEDMLMRTSFRTVLAAGW